ncbi:MAG TPA: maleylpyruvate isomerase N-terminal domain-containing protein [Streptosporangiaceae bacterium]
MDPRLDFLAHLGRESARFAEAVGAAAPDAPVPSCPGWDADDLLWHLAEVQWFWGTVVRERLATPPADDAGPERPPDRAGLAAFYHRASQDLAGTLAATPPDTAVWTWADDHTAGFVRRRQAHEALIHRVDAELAAADRTPMDPLLSADGVDEALRIMYGSVPGWATFTPDPGATLRLRAADTGHTWLVTTGRLTGTRARDGSRCDEPDLHTAASDTGGPAAAVVEGNAADLDCWLWRRPEYEPVTQSGDAEVLARFLAAIEAGID